MKIWNFIESFFQNNSSWLGDFASVAALIAAVVGGLFAAVKFVLKFFDVEPEAKEARQKINSRAFHFKTKIEQEPIFFDENTKQKYFFYENVSLSYNENACQIKSLLNKTYILTGPGGCGKSTLLKYDFVKNISRRKYLSNCAVVFRNSIELIKVLDEADAQNELINTIKATQYKRIILYLDGIDEIGENRVEQLCSFVDRVYELPMRVVIKVTSRPEFASMYIFPRQAFAEVNQNHVMVNPWTLDLLKGFAACLINDLFNINYEAVNGITNVHADILRDDSWFPNVNSPLLVKLFVYIKLQNQAGTLINCDNKFGFYEQFITTVIRTYYRRRSEPINIRDLGIIQQDISSAVFSQFSDGKKYFENNEIMRYISPILKTTLSNKFTFTHETFFEYCVASHYVNQLKNSRIDNRTIAIFGKNYTNDYADFITDAINNNDDSTKMGFVKKLQSIYYHTFSESTKIKYDKKYGSLGKEYINRLPALEPKEFFSLKYEIVFRLGRLGIENKKIGDFLEFVYWNDENIRQEVDSDYYRVVLKRCCAVSASFLASEEIELDYVRHMLPFLKDTFDDNYDLANRSHTLLFYGDVSKKTIFDFQDDDPCVSCDKAFRKRIFRLSQKLPQDISQMDSKTKKKYLFRLFDLATVYTFMYNRKLKLSEEERKILEECNIAFTGASNARIEMMSKIKQNILALDKSL